MRRQGEGIEGTEAAGIEAAGIEAAGITPARAKDSLPPPALLADECRGDRGGRVLQRMDVAAQQWQRPSGNDTGGGGRAAAVGRRTDGRKLLQ